MHLKQKGYCFGVLLIYTVTTITLPSVGWCEPGLYSSRTKSHLTLHNDRNSVLTTKGLLARPSHREGRRRPHPDSRHGEESRSVPHSHNMETRNGIQTEASGGRPGQALKPTMASTSTDRKQADGGWMYTSLNPPSEDCCKGEIKPVIKGEFYITGQLETHTPNVGYQSESAVSVQAQGGQERLRGRRVSGSEQKWQRLQPVVQCGDDAMTLSVRRRRAVQLLLDGMNESSVPLSQLPPQCGYSVQTTWRDLTLRAPYDACHVTQEDDRYVLPLLWRGTPVKMSCPASHIQPEDVGPSSLCCSPHGMTVKVKGLSATEELRVNVRGEWTPLMVLVEKCGYTLDRQDAEIVIAAPLVTCGITVKDGKHTLSLQIGEKTFTLACPVSPPEELPLTQQPLLNSPHLTRGPTPFPWAPPFYLAPLYYPHPTYPHKYPSPDGHDVYNPSTPDPTFGPQSFPPVDSQPDNQDYYSHQIPVRESYKHFSVHSSLSSTDDLEDSSQVYPDLQPKLETPVLGLSERHSATHSPSSDAGFPIQLEASPLHAFNQYYHYYHHPKIPFPGPPEDPDPGPESLTNPHNLEFPVLPQREALSRVNSDQFLQPVPEANSHPYTLPTSAEFVHKASAPYAPYPPEPYPYHYVYYFPHIVRGEAKRSAPPNPNTAAAKTNLSDYQKSRAFVHPLPHSSEVSDKYNLNPYTDQPKPDKTNIKKNSPEWLKPPLQSDCDDVKAELDDKKSHSAFQPSLPPDYPPGPGAVAVPPPEHLSSPTPSPNPTNLPPYPYYYHPYYRYYQMYFVPVSLPSAHNHVSPTSPQKALDPLLQASSSPPQHPSYGKHQTTPPPTKSMYDDHNGPLRPYYYYYHLYYQPQVSVANQQLHPAGSLNSDKASSKSESPLPSDSDYSTMDWLVHATEAGYPSIPQPQHHAFHSLYSHYITQQHPYDPFGHPDEEAEERLNEEMSDHLEANPYTLSASPYFLNFALGCCSFPVKDCTMGQNLIFVVPESVVELTVAPPAHPSEVRNVSCTLQWLTSDPDIYIVPLGGCGVNKHVFGRAVVHLLEVQGAHSLQQDRSSVDDHSPVSSSPGSPGEVRLHVMGQPVQSTPATVTVQLRIATDESFTSFHPEPHLPLSLVRRRPVYVEVILLDPPEPGLVLLVYSCLAYTQAPYTSWMLVYDGCPSQGDSQQLPSPHSDPHHVRRIIISSFLSLPSESPSYMANRGYSHLEDPEIYFLCLTGVCSAADGDCTIGCINSPNSDV